MRVPATMDDLSLQTTNINENDTRRCTAWANGGGASGGGGDAGGGGYALPAQGQPGLDQHAAQGQGRSSDAVATAAAAASATAARRVKAGTPQFQPHPSLPAGFQLRGNCECPKFVIALNYKYLSTFLLKCAVLEACVGIDACGTIYMVEASGLMSGAARLWNGVMLAVYTGVVLSHIWRWAAFLGVRQAFRSVTAWFWSTS